MNVCVISYSVYQFDNRVHRYGSALAEAGHSVDVLALGMDKRKHITYHGADLYQLQVRTIDERGPLSYLAKLLLFFSKVFILLPFLHIKKHYDVIHFHNIPDFAIFSTAVPKLLGVPVIFDIHDLVPEFYARKFGPGPEHVTIKLLKFFEKAACRYADHVITVTELWKKRLVSRSVQAEKCTVILNAPYPGEFDRYTPSGIQHEEFSLLYHGALNEHFGVDIAVRAVALARAEVPGIRFDIYGRGRERARLIELIDDLDLRNTVFIHQPVTREFIPGLIAAATIGIVPKRASAFADEALSSKLLEFAYMEKPVVVSRTTASTTYFSDDMVVFFTPEDVEECAAGIVSLYRDQDLRDACSRNIAAFNLMHSWDVYFQKYLKILGNVLKKTAEE